MLKIYDKFSPRATAPTADYPHGSIKNESVQGVKDGTPLNADWGNDYAGFDAALLAEANITPSGSPDTVNASQRLDAVNLVAVARSLNTGKDTVILSTDTTTVLDDVLYIYDAVAQTAWAKPPAVGDGELIVSVIDDTLTTIAGSYNLETPYDNKTFDILSSLKSAPISSIYKSKKTRLNVLGYDSDGDGGACAWIYDGSSNIAKAGQLLVESGKIVLYLNDGSRCYHESQVNKRCVFAEQVGIGVSSSTATDNNDKYDSFISADIANFYMLKSSYDIVRPLKLFSGKKISGSSLPFRVNTQVKTTINQTVDGQPSLVVDDFDLACSAENLVLLYTGGGTSTAAALDMNPSAQVTTAGLGSKFKNLYARNFADCYIIGGEGSVGWNWEVSFDNCGGEAYSSTCYTIQGFSANCRITDGKGLLGFNTNPAAVAIRILSGNAYIENFRSENNAWTLDVLGGHITFKNLYSEGNRLGDVRSSGGSVTGDFMQAAHTNAGVTTEAVVKVVSGATGIPSVKIRNVALNVSGGNTLSYLTLLEAPNDVEVDFIWGAGVDQSGVNFNNISAEFNPRYAPTRLGFPQYGFEIRRREVQGQTAWAFTANRTIPRGFFDSNLGFELPRVDVNDNPATAYNARRQYSTYTTSAQVDYVNTSSDNNTPTWVTRASLQV